MYVNARAETGDKDGRRKTDKDGRPETSDGDRDYRRQTDKGSEGW